MNVPTLDPQAESGPAAALNAARARAGTGVRGAGSTYVRLLHYLRPYVWPWFVAAVVAMLLFSASTGVLPLLVERIFDDIFAAKNTLALRVLPVVIVLIFLFRASD